MRFVSRVWKCINATIWLYSMCCAVVVLNKTRHWTCFYKPDLHSTCGLWFIWLYIYIQPMYFAAACA